jgi:glucose/arabinose dehydrogenase
LLRPNRGFRFVTLTALVVAAGCSGSSPAAPTPTDGSSTVRGTEHLAWAQEGYGSWLQFRAYVDDKPVDLPSASCDSKEPAECRAPLPSLTNGTHTIALVNIGPSGIESARTNSITVQKLAASSNGFFAALPKASVSGGFRLETVITLGDTSFTADLVATDVRGPAQLAWLPDGRLLVAEADGRVNVVRPGTPENQGPALEAGMLSALAMGTPGIASHPDFAHNHLVYVSLLERDRADQMRLRLVRLREVGDTLGEPATLFEAPLVDGGTALGAGPRMAFGPDRLLYLMLPPGLEFVNEPAASTPRASMVRLTDEGRGAPGDPLSHITSTPLAFTWQPATGALWVMFRGEGGVAALRSLASRERAQAMRADAPRLLAREGTGAAAGTLLLQFAPDNMLVAQALQSTRTDGSNGVARLALPVQDGNGGMADRVGDVVAGDGGTLFVVTNNGLLDRDVVVRLRPLPPSP